MFWCAECQLMSLSADEHQHHATLSLKTHREEVIEALDQIIKFGMEKLSHVEQRVQQVEQRKREIDALRPTFIRSHVAQMEKCFKMFREAVEDYGSGLLKEATQNIAPLEIKCNSTLTRWKETKDTLTMFLAQSASIIPDDEGLVEDEKLVTLFHYFVSVCQLLKEEEGEEELKVVEVKVKSLNTLQMQNECLECAKRITGKLCVEEDNK